MDDKLSYDYFIHNITSGADNEDAHSVRKNCPVSYLLNTLQGK